MESFEIDPEEYEIVKLERKEGVFNNTETGQNIPFKTYYVHIKNKNNPLVMRAKIDKVFNDYVEGTDF